MCLSFDTAPLPGWDGVDRRQRQMCIRDRFIGDGQK